VPFQLKGDGNQKKKEKRAAADVRLFSFALFSPPRPAPVNSQPNNKNKRSMFLNWSCCFVSKKIYRHDENLKMQKKIMQPPNEPFRCKQISKRTTITTKKKKKNQQPTKNKKQNTFGAEFHWPFSEEPNHNINSTRKGAWQTSQTFSLPTTTRFYHVFTTTFP